MTKENKTTLLGGVSYDDEPDFDDVLIFDDKDLYRANLLYQYPVFIPADMGLSTPVPVESPVFISDNNYSNNNNSFNNISNIKYVYIPPKNPEQSLDYINKKGNVKDFGYIPPKQEDIVMKPIKKEKNYDDIAKYFYPDMPDKSQIQESKRTPLLTENNEPQVKYYDDYPTLADRNYVAKPIDKSFTGGAAKITDHSKDIPPKYTNMEMLLPYLSGKTSTMRYIKDPNYIPFDYVSIINWGKYNTDFSEELIGKLKKLLIAIEGDGDFKAYQNKDDVPTIGYGHTKNVKLGTKITQKDAEKFLDEDIKIHIKALNAIKVPLNDNQKVALASLAFNLGETKFKKTKLVEFLNNGELKKAANEFDKLIYSKGKIQPGLIKRRKIEKKLFLTPVS